MDYSNILPHFRKRYTTHIALLLKVLDISEGDVIEMGGGIFSTPLLHWYCKNKNRKLITYEDNLDFYNFERQFQSRHHKIRLIKDWNEVDTTKHRGVVFIDHAGKASVGDWRGFRRGIDAIRFKDTADYIVLHDTEQKGWKTYGYDKMWNYFRYRFDWKECVPETSVISNLVDLSKTGLINHAI